MIAITTVEVPADGTRGGRRTHKRDMLLDGLGLQLAQTRIAAGTYSVIIAKGGVRYVSSHGHLYVMSEAKFEAWCRAVARGQEGVSLEDYGELVGPVTTVTHWTSSDAADEIAL